MGAGRRDELPEDLTRAQRQFRAWRGRRPAGGRIPSRLWDLAAQMANRHGVSRTASALGLDYYHLKKRAATASNQPPSSGPAFIELPSPVVVGKQGLFELVNGAGATLRVQLVGYDPADVEALVHGFWSAR